MTVGAKMNRFEGPSDEPRYPFLTAAACLFVLVLGYLFSCVASSEGTVPSRPDARFAPISFPTSTPEEMETNSQLLVAAVSAPDASGGDGNLPPACVPPDHILQTPTTVSKTYLTCPTDGRCDHPAVRDLAIPDAETPVKYLTVKFHSLANDEGSEILFTRANAEAATEWLNSCFAPWRIQFVFDHRTVYSSYFHDVHDDWGLIWDLGDRYSIDILRNMNIFTTNYWCEWEGQYTLCGGAAAPWWRPLDTPSWTVLMTTNHWRNGGLICHEVGHNFGLHHTFGQFDEEPCGPCDETVGTDDGDFTGDFCSDTAPTPVDPWNTRCAPAPGIDDCTGLPWGETDFRNWMAYTPYAPCKDHFTPQQAGRMHCWLEDRCSDWISYAKIEPDVDFGPAPLRIQFEGVTSMRVNDWEWDFGDGADDQGASPDHVFASPGVYTPSVTLDAAEGIFEATMSRDVWVHTGAISVGLVEVSPGTRTISVPITAANSVPVDFIDLPLHWNGPADLILDAVSTSPAFPAAEWIDLNVENSRGCLRLWTVDGPAMAPGNREVATLEYSVNSDLDLVANSIRLDEYEECAVEFTTDRGPYVPTVEEGAIKFCEPEDCPLMGRIRRPAGRRQTPGVRNSLRLSP